MQLTRPATFNRSAAPWSISRQLLKIMKKVFATSSIPVPHWPVVILGRHAHRPPQKQHTVLSKPRLQWP
jgi:hypothetical protein